MSTYEKGVFINVPFDRKYQRLFKVLGQNSMRGLTNEDEHSNTGRLHCRDLIRLVTDTLVVRYNGPTTLADFNNPVLVLRIIEKVIGMSLNRNPCVPKKRRESFAEIAISEEYRTQAARS